MENDKSKTEYEKEQKAIREYLKRQKENIKRPYQAGSPAKDQQRLKDYGNRSKKDDFVYPNIKKQLKEMLPNREVKGIFTGSRNSVPSNDITVCSFDSLQKINPEDVHLLLIDEPHASVSESRAPLLARFNNARIYGFGATLEGRYDGADKLIKGLIGPIHAARTFQEAVEEGAVCPIKVFFVKVYNYQARPFF